MRAQASASARSDTKAESLVCAEDQIARLERDGYVLIKHAVTEAFARAVSDELEPHFAATPRCEGDFYGWATTRVGGLLAKAPLVQTLALHETVLAIAERVLGPACDCIQLNLTQAVRVHPGERAQAPHRDEEMWPHTPKPGPWLINVMWPLSRFTRENGATRIWPGSHRHALDRGIDEDQALAIDAEPGDALVFLGAVTHGAGANRTEAARSGVIISYCLGWLKQYENQYLAYPREVARWFPEHLQRLIGYRMHRPNLGGVEGQDPIETLRTGEGPRGHVDALPPDIAAQLKDYYGG